MLYQGSSTAVGGDKGEESMWMETHLFLGMWPKSDDLLEPALIGFLELAVFARQFRFAKKP